MTDFFKSKTRNMVRNSIRIDVQNLIKDGPQSRSSWSQVRGGANLVHPPLVADTEIKWGGWWIYFGKKKSRFRNPKIFKTYFFCFALGFLFLRCYWEAILKSVRGVQRKGPGDPLPLVAALRSNIQGYTQRIRLYFLHFLPNYLIHL